MFTLDFFVICSNYLCENNNTDSVILLGNEKAFEEVLYRQHQQLFNTIDESLCSNTLWKNGKGYRESKKLGQLLTQKNLKPYAQWQNAQPLQQF